MLIYPAVEELEIEYVDVKFVKPELTTASEGFNSFDAAHFMAHYYCHQNRRAHREIKQIK